MLIIAPGGVPASGSERRVLEALADHGGPGVVYANFHVTQNRRRREIDAFVMTPQGCVVVEVKGTAVPGTVETPADWPWSVDGRTDAFKTSAGEANPGTQADTAAKILASALGAAGCDVGFVASAVILDGPDLRLSDTPPRSGGSSTSAAAEFVENGTTKVLLVEAIPAGLRFLRGSLAASQVLAALAALGVPAHALPQHDALIEAGFATTASPRDMARGPHSTGNPNPTDKNAIKGAGWSRWIEGPWTWGMKGRAVLLVFVAFTVLNDWLDDGQGSVAEPYRGTWVETVADDWAALTRPLDDYTTVAVLIVPATLFWQSRWRALTSALRGFYLAQLALVLLVAASPLSTRASVRTPEDALAVGGFTTAAPFVFWSVFVVATAAPVLTATNRRRRKEVTQTAAT